MNLLTAIEVFYGGALAGGLAGVIGSRVPKGESIVAPGSYCDTCRRPLRLWESIPILGWLFTGGRCRSCGTRVSLFGVGVEVFMGLVAVELYHGYGASPTAALMFLFAFGFVAAALVDWETTYIPVAIPVGLALLWGVAYVWHLQHGWIIVAPGAFTAAGVMFVASFLYAAAGRLIFGKLAYGVGDWLLGAVMGLYLGLYWAVLAWLGAGVVALAVYLIRTRGHLTRGILLPFVPALAVGSAVAMNPSIQVWFLNLYPHVWF